VKHFSALLLPSLRLRVSAVKIAKEYALNFAAFAVFAWKIFALPKGPSIQL
jgi:hypothetical protein